MPEIPPGVLWHFFIFCQSKQAKRKYRLSNSLILAVLAGLTGMLGWGLADFFAKKTIDVVGDMATLTWAHIYGTLFVGSILLGLTLAGGTQSHLPKNSHELAIIAFFGVLQAVVYILVYRAFGKGKLALLNPVFSSYSGLVVVMSVLIFGELITGWQFVCLAIIFMGVISISLDSESLKLRKLKLARIPGMRDILAATILASLWTVLWGHFVSGKDWLVYAAIMYAFMTLTVIVVSLVQRVKLNVVNGKTWKYFFLIGASEVIAYAGVSLGYSQTSRTSIVAVLSAAFSVPTVILAYLFLKERVTKFQVLGIAFVITGVVLISMVSRT